MKVLGKSASYGVKEETKKKLPRITIDGEEEEIMKANFHGENLSLADWKKGRVLGRASYGVVYLGIPSKPHLATVAIRVAPFSDLPSFVREEFALAKLKASPHIVRCIASAVHSKVPSGPVYNVLEYSPSDTTLADLIVARDRLPNSHARRYLRTILQGLSAVHATGHVHCDLKPHNILAFPSPDGGDSFDLKITDFGLTKWYRSNWRSDDEYVDEYDDDVDEYDDDEYDDDVDEYDDDVDEYGADVDEYGAPKRRLSLRFRGTPRYMSPESLTGEIYPALDVWSVGCVLVDMITGKGVWNGCSTSKELLLKLLDETATPDVPEELSAGGKDFLRKCFERNPRERWTVDMLLDHPYLVEEEEEIQDVGRLCSAIIVVVVLFIFIFFVLQKFSLF